MEFSDADLVAQARGAGESARSLIADELVPWTLGYGDPIALRVASRGPNPGLESMRALLERAREA